MLKTCHVSRRQSASPLPHLCIKNKQQWHSFQGLHCKKRALKLTSSEIKIIYLKGVKKITNFCKQNCSHVCYFMPMLRYQSIKWGYKSLPITKSVPCLKTRKRQLSNLPCVWHWAPLYPSGHAHVKDVPSTVQSPPFWQGWGKHGFAERRMSKPFRTIFYQ